MMVLYSACLTQVHIVQNMLSYQCSFAGGGGEDNKDDLPGYLIAVIIIIVVLFLIIVIIGIIILVRKVIYDNRVESRTPEVPLKLP